MPTNCKSRTVTSGANRHMLTLTVRPSVRCVPNTHNPMTSQPSRAPNCNCNCKCNVSKCLYFETLHLQLQLQLGARDGCDVIGLCVFGTHLTDGLTVTVSIWRLATLITVRDLQLVGMPSFTRYFVNMTSIYFISINYCPHVLPIYNRVYKIILVPIGLT